uniref:Uncharacterized protein n=1 Tax=Gopherus evgoodei TaxID=1825980 RepID=A0A8C4YM45_9SAUR
MGAWEATARTSFGPCCFPQSPLAWSSEPHPVGVVISQTCGHEKTVEYLESEVKTLLKDISETAWSAPIAPGTPLVDIFDGLLSLLLK